MFTPTPGSMFEIGEFKQRASAKQNKAKQKQSAET